MTGAGAHAAGPVASRPPARRTRARGPVADRDLGRAPAAGSCRGSVAVSKRLPAALARAARRAAPALRVELAHHVVEQHQRRRPARVEQGSPLGEQQRQQRGALLALRAVAAQRAAAERDRELVEVRAVRSYARARGPRSRRSASSAASSAGVGRLASAGGTASGRARRAGRARPPPAANSAAERSDRVAPGPPISSTPGLGQLPVPGVERVRRRGAGADPAEQRVALRERARVARAEPRPRAGHSAAQNRSRWRASRRAGP